jgi:FkbM family methyltransferase
MSEAAVFQGIDVGENRHRDIVVDGICSVGETRHGRMKWVTTDYGVGQTLALYGEYSEGEVALFRNLVKPGDWVVSAGGNIGVHLIPLSRMVGDVGRVITFEPQATLRGILDENLRVNGCRNVEVHPYALAREGGEVFMPVVNYSMPNNFGGLGLVGEEIERESVRAVSLDALKLERLDFLMLDVEGAEEDALRGARATIDRHRPRLYVEIDKEDKREPLLHFMTDELRYEVLFHLPYVFNRDNFAGNPVNHFGDMRSIMCLGIPR